MRDEALTIVCVGDIHGHYDVLAGHLDAVRDVHGPVDLVVSVGDAEALRCADEVGSVHGPRRYRRLGEFPRVLSGELTLGAPMVFIGGNHEPWAELDRVADAANGRPVRWADDVWFLGRAGAGTFDVAGRAVHLAWLSGIRSESVSPGDGSERSGVSTQARRARCYYLDREVARTTDAARRRRTDILITHDWPAGLAGAMTRRGEPTGDLKIDTLTRSVRPSVHVCGHLHHRQRGDIDGVRVEALGHVRAGSDALFVVRLEPDGALTALDVPYIAALPRDHGD